MPHCKSPSLVPCVIYIHTIYIWLSSCLHSHGTVLFLGWFTLSNAKRRLSSVLLTYVFWEVKKELQRSVILSFKKLCSGERKSVVLSGSVFTVAHKSSFLQSPTVFLWLNQYQWFERRRIFFNVYYRITFIIYFFFFLSLCVGWGNITFPRLNTGFKNHCDVREHNSPNLTNCREKRWPPGNNMYSGGGVVAHFCPWLHQVQNEHLVVQYFNAHTGCQRCS